MSSKTTPKKITNPKTTRVEEKEEAPQDVNTAVVYDGKRAVRRYTAESHGQEFKNLADEFAEKKGYSVEYTSVEPRVECPGCGHRFNP